MPNWVKTIIKTKPNIMKDVLNNYSVDGNFSFDKVIPMPKSLDIESGSRGEEGLMCLFSENSLEISKDKINEVYRSLNPFYDDIYKDSRFQTVVNNYEKEKEKYQDNIELSKIYVSNYEQFGHATWYDWRLEKWGTKWDLNSFSSNKDTMIYQTAWGFSGEIILELSKKYPNESFYCKFADEGLQENSGIVEIKNGEVVEERYRLTNKEIDEIWNTYIPENSLEEQDLEIEKE